MNNNNIMKKILYLFFALFVLLPMATNAATFSFIPNTGSFVSGKTFNVTVYVNPGVGEQITTAKLSAAFSASGLDIVSFSPAAGWMPLTAPGYDFTNNTTGKFIKTGGFPARVTKSKQFGVLKLKAKKVGVATINTEGDSMMLDITNTNKYVALKGASFNIIKAIVKKPIIVKKPKKVFNKIMPAKQIAKVINKDTITNDGITTTPALQNQTAAAAAAGNKTNNRNTIYYIIGFIILAGIFVWRKWGNKNRS